MMETCLGTPGTTWKVGYTLENHWTNWGTSTWQSNFDWRVATETMVIYGDLPVKYGDFPFEFPEGATVALWRSGANFDLGIHLFFRTPKNVSLGFHHSNLRQSWAQIQQASQERTTSQPGIRWHPLRPDLFINSHPFIFMFIRPFTSIHIHLCSFASM